MTTQAMITMICFLAGIWGGFLFLLIRALRRDRATADE
jgi:preprotein translocase subunit YajC